ncbi:MAG: GntR family transcriptional regulator [Thermodesulfobacteriota bacterium]|nr:GntR family transcriptional regulator [Thermodesulfobacteriota bacterium]
MMKSLLPAYYQIKETIRNWILNKEFTPGQKIPSVQKLADQFKVNHLTVRHAIEHLEQEGFLVSKRGSGTFVSNNEALISSMSTEITGFMDEIFYQVQKAKTKSAEMKVIEPPKIVREKLELGDKEKKVLQIKRVRFLDHIPFNYAVNYLPMEIGSKIVKKELFKKPLLQILEQDFNIQFSEVVQIIQASFADSEVSEKLGIPCGSPTLFVERVLYTKHRKPVQMFQAHYRGDLFKYIVRIKNIRKKNGNIWVHHDRVTSKK